MIRAIDEESAQRIVAGQAVTDLASAVKELVDNALDAGSTGINIRLFNQGLDILEVSDDGSGVPPESRPFLAQAHATSKIRSFDDIYSKAKSLGFRGEALFCLANLSEKLIIATRTEDEPVGQKMEFNNDGKMKTAVASVPRKVGTTVAVVKLFNTLPVRRVDMERRIFQHRINMMRVMEGYAIFSVGVRINLMDVVGRKENTLLATAANCKKLEQTISSVLGSKFLGSVAPFSIDLKETMDAASPQGDWKLEGFLSKAPLDHGSNGAKAGQQFFSINGRPVELPKLARTIGDVWRSLGGKKKFSCILAMTLPNQEYDVNLSPEKRQVLFTNEDAISHAVQAGVAEFWASQTDGKFTSSASLPIAKKMASGQAPAPAPLKAPPTKINSMDSIAKTQESNRKRTLHLLAQMASEADNRAGGAMDVNLHDDRTCGDDDDIPASRSAYIRRFKEEQNEQRKLNASEGASLQYGEENPNVQEQQPPAADSRRVRRRGGFVHDISTAKQWERPSSSGKELMIPPEIKNRDACEDTAGVELVASEKRQSDPPPSINSPVQPVNKCSMEASVASFPTEDELELCPSRRVTLTLNNAVGDDRPACLSMHVLPAINEQAHSHPQASSIPVGTTTTPESPKHNDTGLTYGDIVLRTEAQCRFNQRDASNPDKDAADPMKSSVSPFQAPWETPPNRSNPTTKSSNRPQALNMEQAALWKLDSSKEAAMQCKTAVTPTEFAVTQQLEVSRDLPFLDSKRSSQAIARGTGETIVAQYDVCDGTEDFGGEINDKSTSPQATDAPPARSQMNCDLVWGSFIGTDKVFAMAKSERERMQARKRRVRSTNSSDGEDERPSSSCKEQKISLSKSGLGSMTVVGQFNLGFIVCTNALSYLWILDQHACDERLKFEHLLRETVMHNQQLIAPIPLELDPWEESCVLDNMEVFGRNGFHFLYSRDNPPRHHLSLTALPHSGARDGRKAVTYGPEDVSALCAILVADGREVLEDEDYYVSGGTGIDGSGMYGNNAVRRYAGSSQLNGKDSNKMVKRLPKAIAMFASRACRGSIMIGTALSKIEMEKVVGRMGSLADPWKCAHGRPTSTHVSTLRSHLLKDEREMEERISGPTLAANLYREPLNDDV